MDNELRLAVLIDAENFSSKYVKKLFDEIAVDGHASIRRVYGGWAAPQLKSWKKIMESYSISTRQECCYSIGKSASDSAMIIDAMDILYGGVIDGFCIASSDGDFTNLARRLREAGKLILGAGENKTPKAFVNSCNKFIYIDLLDACSLPEAEPVKDTNAAGIMISDKKTIPEKEDEAAKEKARSKATGPAEENGSDEEVGPTPINIIKSELLNYFNAKASVGDENRINLGLIGSYLRKKHPDFDCRNYKCKTLAQMVKTFKEFEIEVQPSESDPRSKSMYVVLKTGKPKARRTVKSES